jgi:hypothetical protein
MWPVYVGLKGLVKGSGRGDTASLGYAEDYEEMAVA